jgi:hypothetical protein
MKQFSVTASALLLTLLAFGLQAAGVTIFDSGQTAFDRPSESMELREFSAQSRQERPRIRVRPPAASPYPRPDDYSWPGPGAVRQCVDWYATEYRPSGTVITPQMRCRWVRRY